MPRVAKPIILPAAQAAPAPPPGNLPTEVGAGGHHHKGPQFDVDQFDIDSEPVMVSTRKTHGTPGLRKDQQQKLTLIVLGGMGFALLLAVVLIIVNKDSIFGTAPEKDAAKEAKTDETAPDKKTEAEKTTEDKPKPDKRIDEDKWVDAGKPIRRGDAEVKITTTTRGGAPDDVKLDDGVDAKEVLVVKLRLKNSNDDSTRKLEYKGFTPSLRNRTVLKDDGNNDYELLGVSDGKSSGKSITSDDDPISIFLVFQPPSKTAKYFHLELPAAAFGDKVGPPLKLEIRKGAVTTATTKPVSKKTGPSVKTEDEPRPKPIKPKLVIPKELEPDDDDSGGAKVAPPRPKPKKQPVDDPDKPPPLDIGGPEG